MNTQKRIQTKLKQMIKEAYGWTDVLYEAGNHEPSNWCRERAIGMTQALSAVNRIYRDEYAKSLDNQAYPEPSDREQHLDEPCPFWSHSSKEPGDCLSNFRHLVCTREAGHQGPHIAHGSDPNMRYAVWTNEEGTK